MARYTFQTLGSKSPVVHPRTSAEGAVTIAKLPPPKRKNKQFSDTGFIPINTGSCGTAAHQPAGPSLHVLVTSGFATMRYNRHHLVTLLAVWVVQGLGAAVQPREASSHGPEPPSAGAKATQEQSRRLSKSMISYGPPSLSRPSVLPRLALPPSRTPTLPP